MARDRFRQIKRLNDLSCKAASKAAVFDTLFSFIEEETPADPDVVYDVSYKASHFSVLSKKFKDRMNNILSQVEMELIHRA